mmetsp:Transcript_56111/g.122704  ORF Transcript_56111/g.122704 Transcript_56111/m.122704 type:complete len:225 (-) Transcript_56111:792-1466(-)
MLSPQLIGFNLLIGSFLNALDLCLPLLRRLQRLLRVLLLALRHVHGGLVAGEDLVLAVALALNNNVRAVIDQLLTSHLQLTRAFFHAFRDCFKGHLAPFLAATNLHVHAGTVCTPELHDGFHLRLHRIMKLLVFAMELIQLHLQKFSLRLRLQAAALSLSDGSDETIQGFGFQFFEFTLFISCVHGSFFFDPGGILLRQLDLFSHFFSDLGTESFCFSKVPCGL